MKLQDVFGALALGLIGLSVASCDDKDDANGTGDGSSAVTAEFTAEPAVDGTIPAETLEGLSVTFTETKSSDETVALLDDKGMAVVSINKGVYNIVINKTIKSTTEKTLVGTDSVYKDSIYLSLLIENFSIKEEGQKITGTLTASPAGATGNNFIFSEIFFNGERNSGKMMHPDQYFVIFNPTSEVLYADGVSVAVTHHLSWWDKKLWYDSYYPNNVPVGGFVTIPGNGRQYPVNPGERVVVAFTAIDHSAVDGYDHAVNLTGADFEIYNGPESTDVDNPDVPNVTITTNSDSYGFFFQPRGYMSPLMFKLENGETATINAFVQAHTSTANETVAATDSTAEYVKQIQILSVPTEMILDGVQTSDVPQDVKTRVIPETVDRGKFLVNGCHRGELAIRKTVMVGNVVYYQDTNDSSEDFILQEGQNSFPLGWRNNK